MQIISKEYNFKITYNNISRIAASAFNLLARAPCSKHSELQALGTAIYDVMDQAFVLGVMILLDSCKT